MKIIDIRSTIPKHETLVPKSRTSPPTHIVVHCTASNNQDPNQTALYHVTPGPSNHISKKGAPCIGYSDFITNNGTIYHCVDYLKITWHAGLFNNKSIGIVIAHPGDKTSIDNRQYNSLIKYLAVLCLYFKILPSNVIGHKEVPGMYTLLGNGSRVFKKRCPGDNLCLDKMRVDLIGCIQKRLIYEDLYNGKLDFVFGKKTLEAFMKFNPLKNKNRNK